MLRLDDEQLFAGGSGHQKTRQMMSVLPFDEFDRHVSLIQLVAAKCRRRPEEGFAPGRVERGGRRPRDEQPRRGNGFDKPGREVGALEVNHVAARFVRPLHCNCKGIVH